MTGRACLAFLFLAVLPLSAWSLNTDQDIVVHVQMDGQIITVDVDCPVDAPWSIVWEVLTDYDHMAQFISNLEYSGVDDRVDNVLRVHQKGKAVRAGACVRSRTDGGRRGRYRDQAAPAGHL